MNKLVKLNFIVSDQEVVGKGTEEDPMRRILKASTENGTCVFEYDIQKNEIYITANLVEILKKSLQD